MHFTVTGGNEAGVDLVVIQSFLLSYVNQVIVFFSIFSIRKGRTFLPKQGQLQPHIHSKARILSSQLQNGLFINYAFFIVKLAAGQNHYLLSGF